MSWTPPAPAALLEALDATWSALERRPLGPWTLRRGGGGGNRASSVRPRGAVPDDLDAALAEVVRQAAVWGQPPIVQLGPEDAALDAALDARGWAVTDSNVIYAAPAAHFEPPPRDEGLLARVEAPLALLDALWDAGNIGPARRAVMAAVAGPKTRLIARAGDRPAGACFVASAGGIAVMSALFVLPEFRRRGVGALAVRGAADWAREQGAPSLALAVGGDNAPARGLYEGLGFRRVCGYSYRRAP
jgi:GNAT superfamily N-acetyltransferase